MTGADLINYITTNDLFDNEIYISDIDVISKEQLNITPAHEIGIDALSDKVVISLTIQSMAPEND